MSSLPTDRIELPDVTLIAVSSVNLAATVAALDASMRQITFGAAKLLSDQRPQRLSEAVEWISIAPLKSSSDYSRFMLEQLADHVTTLHALTVQWDGHVTNADMWQPDFLAYDYIGASWPQFDDGHDVGNGGFSLRSRALMEACRAPGFTPSHPEDVAIGRRNRSWLESRGIRFAPSHLADAFSAERAGSLGGSFGYHGVWHMPHVLGREKFWQIYRSLDERGSIRHDFGTILRHLAAGRGGLRRAIHLIHDRIGDTFNQRKPTL